MVPFKRISEDDTHITYEYRPAYTWALYGAVVGLLIGGALESDAITIAAVVVVAVCFVANFVLGRDARRRIKQAMRSNSVQMSGSRISFSNPLRIRVPK